MSRKAQLGVFLAIFFAVLLGTSREVPWSDAKQLHQVAEGIAFRGEIDIQVRTVLFRDGKSYALHPFLASAVHVPGAFIQRHVGERWPDWQRQHARALTSHLGPALCAAVAGVYFLRLLLLLGLSPVGASLATILMAFGTMVAVYARSPYSEIVQTACFLAFFYHLLSTSLRPRAGAAVLLGLWAGLLLNTKAIFLLSFPGAVAFLVARQLRGLGAKRVAILLGWAALGLLPGILTMAWYNHARTGDVTNIGYPIGRQSKSEFVEAMFLGLWGLFFSPNKSVFLYSPPLVAAMFALPRALRVRKDWLVALAFTAAPVVMFYGKFVFWSGDWCWGPRYILFTVPLLLLPLTFVLDEALVARRRLLLAGLAGVFAVGFAVQVLGAAFYWDHPVRMAREARTRWLGEPNRSGAISRDSGGNCDPCYEDFYPLQWVSALQPIELNYWMLGHVLRDHPWEVAEADAPWHRYTTLKLDVRASYQRLRLDWWFLDFDADPFRGPGRVLLGLMAIGLVAGGGLWARGCGNRAPRPPAV